MRQPTAPGDVAGPVKASGRMTAAADLPRPVSLVHARALYQPVPPVDRDDDGYPYSDSSVVESTRHHRARSHLVDVLRTRYADRGDVFAAAELGFYFERGNRSALVVPDAMVVFGIRDHPDLSYKLWEHGKVPDLVLEVLSKRTWRKDVYDKPGLYAALGVREYWLFDAYGVRRDGGEPIQALRLSASGDWFPAATARTAGALVSEVLGLEVLIQEGELRFREPGSDDVLPDAVESARLREQEAARADREAARADREAARAEQEAARAQQEAARAEAAQRRIVELEDRLQHQGN